MLGVKEDDVNCVDIDDIWWWKEQEGLDIKGIEEKREEKPEEMKKVGDEEGERGEHVESERGSGGERQLGGGQQVSAKCNLII